MKVFKNVLKALWHCVRDFIGFALFMMGCCIAILFVFFLLVCAAEWAWSFVPAGISTVIGNAVPWILGAILTGAMLIAIGLIIKDEYDRIVAAESPVIPADDVPVYSGGIFSADLERVVNGDEAER